MTGQARPQKAKAAKDANSSFFEVDRLSKLSELARKAASGAWIKNAGYAPNSLEIEESRGAAEIRMFKAELAYRDALTRLEQLMGVPIN